MRMQRVAFVIFCGSLFLICAVQSAIACSCGPKPTLLDSFESSNLIIATKLISVEKTREKEREYDIGYISSVKMLVEKVYKGNVKEGDILTFGQGGGADCIWTYDEDSVGSRYLFYLGLPTKGHPFFNDEESNSEKEPMYHAVACGRSNGLTGAAADLAYLNNIEKLKGKTRFSGTYSVWSNDEPNFADLKIKIIGKKQTYYTKTNKDGFFEIYDLPPGDYVVQPTIPFGWKYNNYMLERSASLTRESEYEDIKFDPKNGVPITIKEKRHAELDLVLDIDTAIIGRVLSPAGSPMKDVCLMAVSTELKQGDYRGQSDCTDPKGQFVIDEIAPGNYILVVNRDGKLDGDEPFGTMFYPGVSEFKNAGVIRVDAGKYAVGKDIQIPKTAELIEISGRFLYSDGKPVVDERVEFAPDDRTRFDEAGMSTDKLGRFSFRIPKGASGKLSGEMFTYIGEFKSCQAQEKLIKETGKTNITFNTESIALNGEEPKVNIELVFPFPGCEKAKEE